MVKKVTLRFLERFKKAYKKLPLEIQQRTDNKLALFQNNFRHPSLRVKKILGTKDIWEGSITDNDRFTFQIEPERYVLRNVGLHDETIENP